MERSYIIRKNGKPMIRLSKKFSGRIGDMAVKRVNIHIIENKNKIDESDRRFIISIREDGKNTGEYKIAQINFNEEELKELRDNIDIILNRK